MEVVFCASQDPNFSPSDVQAAGFCELETEDRDMCDQREFEPFPLQLSFDSCPNN